MTQEILALSNLYKNTTKKFRTIKQEYIDDEVEITHIALDIITQYFMELLQAIPKDFYISYNNTLFIKFEKIFIMKTLNITFRLFQLCYLKINVFMKKIWFLENH